MGPGRMTPVVRWLLGATVAAFFLQVILDRFTNGLFSLFYMGLSWRGIQSGRVWQLVTYMFMHGGLFHLLMNMLGLYFMGPETERALGRARFLILYFLSGILGGLGWLLISSNAGTPCVGASGAIFGIIGAFCAIFPNRMITVLVFFILPITMRAWVLGVALMGLELYYLGNEPGGIAYAAHLAGGLSGYIYAWTLFRGIPESIRDMASPWTRPSLTVLKGGKDEPPPKASADIDAILDKISRQGIKSLTRHERTLLEKASQEL